MVAIILVIAAIAIPNLLRSRMAANEAAAVSAIREIRTAEIAYSVEYPSLGFALDLANLGGGSPCAPSPVTSCLLDSSLASATVGSSGRSGYVFAATGIASGTFNHDYVAGGSPLTSGTNGNHNFCVTTDALLRKQVSSAGDVPVTTVSACRNFPLTVN